MIDIFNGLTNWFVANLTFFASGLGLITIGAFAILMIVFWDWRITLLGLIAIQVGVVVLILKVYQLPLIWGNVQLLVVVLSATMLALSASQVSTTLRLQKPGSFFVRLSAVILLTVSWRFIELDLMLPFLTSQITQLFLWLIVCSLVLLGLSNSPLHTGVALLIWFVPVQVIIEILLPGYGLFVQIAMVELFVSLTCSYLILAQRQPVVAARRVLTDISFPIDAEPLPALPQSGWAPRLQNHAHVRDVPRGARALSHRSPSPLPSSPAESDESNSDSLEKTHTDTHARDTSGEQQQSGANGTAATGWPL